jgi:hypothetical protein
MAVAIVVAINAAIIVLSALLMIFVATIILVVMSLVIIATMSMAPVDNAAGKTERHCKYAECEKLIECFHGAPKWQVTWIDYLDVTALVVRVGEVWRSVKGYVATRELSVWCRT